MLTMSSNQSLEGTQMLWDYLDKTYKQNTVAPAYQLFHKIHNTHLSNNGTITEYLEKITRQAFELDQLRWKIPDSIIASVGEDSWSVIPINKSRRSLAI